MPEQLKTIAPGAFYACRSLKEVEIPSGIETISFGAFSGCKSALTLIGTDGAAREYAVGEGIAFRNAETGEVIPCPRPFLHDLLYGTLHWINTVYDFFGEAFALLFHAIVR